ncbi:hypothetical protein ABZX88_31020 [Kitasatospora aureofaciens]|uniref:hypothetical protein n=1 Tax=Kitasatospora aureofaciens TaxID=1894 RepID=UPI0033AE71E1
MRRRPAGTYRAAEPTAVVRQTARVGGVRHEAPRGWILQIRWARARAGPDGVLGERGGT